MDQEDAAAADEIETGHGILPLFVFVWLKVSMDRPGSKRKSKSPPPARRQRRGSIGSESDAGRARSGSDATSY